MRFLPLAFLLMGTVVFGQNSRSRIQDSGNQIQDSILEDANRQEEKDRQKAIAKFNKDVDAAMVKLVEAETKGLPDPSLPVKKDTAPKDKKPKKPKSRNQLLAEKAQMEQEAQAAAEIRQQKVWAAAKEKIAAIKAEKAKQKAIQKIKPKA